MRHIQSNTIPWLCYLSAPNPDDLLKKIDMALLELSSTTHTQVEWYTMLQHYLEDDVTAYQLMLIEETQDELVKALALAKQTPKDEFYARKQTKDKLIFLFTGQGSQYVDMGKQLYELIPHIQKTMDQCFNKAQEYHLALKEAMFPDNPDLPTLLNQTNYTQPALYTIEMALNELLERWGVHASMSLGHSVGEYAAASASGLCSLEDGMRLILKRGDLMQSCEQGYGMLATRAHEDALNKTLSQDEYKQTDIAAYNAPNQTVLSGPLSSLTQLKQDLQQLSSPIRSTLLQVSHGFHSVNMDPILDAFEKAAAMITWTTPSYPCISNVHAKPLTLDRCTPMYWRDHIRQAVRFKQSLSYLGEQHDQQDIVFLEIGPHPILLRLCKDHDAPQVKGATCLSTLDKRQTNNLKSLLVTLKQLLNHHVPLHWGHIIDDLLEASKKQDTPKRNGLEKEREKV